MDHQRQSGFARSFNVLSKALRLIFTRSSVVVIVEASLANGYDLRVLGSRNQRRGVDVELFVRVVRVGTDRAEDIREFFRDRKYLCVFLHTGRDSDDAADSGFPRPRHDIRALGREIRKIEVAMAVHQHFQAFASGST